jgi:hypothetical protein
MIIDSLVSLLFVAALIPQPSFAQDKVIATYTLPDTPIKAFQNAAFPGNVAIYGAVPKTRGMNFG